MSWFTKEQPAVVEKFCNQVVEANGGNGYGYSENYQFSNKDAGAHKEP